MEHGCIQCGASVEDGRPFCPQCRAPQIRVPPRPAEVMEPDAADAEETPEGFEAAADERGGAGGTEPERFVSGAALGAPQGAPQGAALGEPQENKLIWRPAFSSALVAGLLAAVGTSIPIIPLAMLCMFASGGLAVTLYRRRIGQGRVTPWMGARLGLLAGGLGFGLLAVLSALRLFAASERTELRTAFREKMQEAMASPADPDVRQAMEQFRGYIATDHGLILVVLLCLAVAAIFFLIFSALGGALGALLFGGESGRTES